MFESKKTNLLRDEAFFEKYFSGKVIDIGAGDDLVCSWAERFDQEDGDANFITKYKASHTYDTVHSSHCLEHMHNPCDALEEWWTIIKPGGYLVLVVPDEDLYEQGMWPSRFNADHKCTFTLKNDKSWSPVSYNICNLVTALPGAEIISAEVQDKFYNYDHQTKYPSREEKPVPRRYRRLGKILKLFPTLFKHVDRLVQDRLFKIYQIPIDQTMREALAQIQIIARKNIS